MVGYIGSGIWKAVTASASLGWAEVDESWVEEFYYEESSEDSDEEATLDRVEASTEESVQDSSTLKRHHQL